MRIYKFLDTDSMGREDYDICGESYRELIRTCCKYSKTVSLRITNPKTMFQKELKKYQGPKEKNITYVYEHYYGKTMVNPPDVKYYRICPELCQLFIEISNSIFKWIYGWGYANPEDPVFYREDGSVFFSSLIHDGECILLPREGEDVSKIIAQANWISCEI